MRLKDESAGNLIGDSDSVRLEFHWITNSTKRARLQQNDKKRTSSLLKAQALLRSLFHRTVAALKGFPRSSVVSIPLLLCSYLASGASGISTTPHQPYPKCHFFMMKHGSPMWILWLFGIITVPIGFLIWHRLGPKFGLGESNSNVDEWAAYLSLGMFTVLFLATFLISPRF